MRVGAATPTRFGIYAYGPRGFDPFLGGQRKAVQALLAPKPLEFDRFKIGVVQLFPGTKKLDGIPVAQPVVQNALVTEFLHQFVELTMNHPS